MCRSLCIRSLTVINKTNVTVVASNFPNRLHAMLEPLKACKSFYNIFSISSCRERGNKSRGSILTIMRALKRSNSRQINNGPILIVKPPFQVKHLRCFFCLTRNSNTHNGVICFCNFSKSGFIRAIHTNNRSAARLEVFKHLPFGLNISLH